MADATATFTDTLVSGFRQGLFEGQTALVTGGGTGIGLRTARELAHLGTHSMSILPMSSHARREAHTHARTRRRHCGLGFSQEERSRRGCCGHQL